MQESDLAKIILDWSSTFIHLSLQDFNRYTRAAGLSLAHMTVLMDLYYHGHGEVTHFCDMMQITPAGASQMIERMVQQGAVQRVKSSGDGRVRLVELTELGRQIVLESVAAREAWVGQLIETLSIEDGERVSAALNILMEHARSLEIRRS